MPCLPVLFDANASVGNPAGGTPDCATAAMRVAHMDRLGIDRALVWNVEGMQHHSLSANRSLLDEIKRTPGAAGRLIPELVVSGLIAYERRGIEQLVEQMREGQTRALRFVSLFTFAPLSLCQCQPVIEGVRHLKPFILVAGSDTTSRDVLDFTAEFPEAPVILTNQAWGQGIGSFDLMRRRPSVMLDISWWHTWEGIALAVKHFGAERLLFGTGYRSHAGAAIAALARAQITDAQRELIAHGNLERLTGPLPQHAAYTASKGNLYWQRCLAGEPLGTDIVDAHGHIGGSAGYLLENNSERDQIAAALRVMDRLGQRTMIVSGMQALLGSPVEGNRALYDAIKSDAERFLMYLAFNPFYGSEIVPQFDAWFARPQVAGFKILCSYWKVPVTDERFTPMWEYANRHRLPILMHTWSASPDAPALTRPILQKYPDLSLLLGHSGGSDEGRREAEELGAKFPNVYLETCGSFCSTLRWEETLKKVPVSQIVYGSDAMGHDAHWEMGRLLSMDVSEEVLAPILGGNMRRVLARRQ